MLLCHIYRYFEFEMVDKEGVKTDFYFTMKPLNADVTVRRRVR